MNLLKLSIILFILTSTTKCPLDFNLISELILNYDNLPSQQLKRSVKILILELISNDLQNFKQDENIYEGEKKEMIDKLKSCINKLGVFKSIENDENKLKLIINTIKLLWETKDSVRIGAIKKQLKNHFEIVEEFFYNNIKMQNVSGSLQENDNTTHSSNNNLRIVKAKFNSDSENLEKKLDKNDIDNSRFLVIVGTIIVILLIVIFLFLCFLIRRRRFSSRDAEYVNQTNSN